MITIDMILALPDYLKVVLGAIVLVITWLLSRGIFFILKKTFGFLATLAIMGGLLYAAFRLLSLYG